MALRSTDWPWPGVVEQSHGPRLQSHRRGDRRWVEVRSGASGGQSVSFPIGIRFRTEPQVRYDWTLPRHLQNSAEPITVPEVRYDWIPREKTPPGQGEPSVHIK